MWLGLLSFARKLFSHYFDDLLCSETISIVLLFSTDVCIAKIIEKKKTITKIINNILQKYYNVSVQNYIQQTTNPTISSSINFEEHPSQLKILMLSHGSALKVLIGLEICLQMSASGVVVARSLIVVSVLLVASCCVVATAESSPHYKVSNSSDAIRQIFEDTKKNSFNYDED